MSPIVGACADALAIPDHPPSGTSASIIRSVALLMDCAADRMEVPVLALGRRGELLEAMMATVADRVRLENESRPCQVSLKGGETVLFKPLNED
jgi:hypothetical protein